MSPNAELFHQNAANSGATLAGLDATQDVSDLGVEDARCCDFYGRNN